MDFLATHPPVNIASRHRFSPGDEVTLQCGSAGIIQEVLPANHYRILNKDTGQPVVEHDYSLVGKPKRPSASLPQPSAPRAEAPWRGVERRRP